MVASALNKAIPLSKKKKKNKANPCLVPSTGCTENEDSVLIISLFHCLRIKSPKNEKEIEMELI